jgi:2-amino-4-hydroxy-6-hydroxymethyldihydropteridine diphosphokinase
MKSPSTIVLLGLGANVGDREQALSRAVALLLERKAIYAPAISSLYETEPVGYTDQPSFLNMAVMAGTMLLPAKLLAVCKEVERHIGRIARPRWHEREIDIDILLYHNKIMAQNDLVIPHPHMHERKFVLVPAAEVAPRMLHPLYRKTIEELLHLCPDTAHVERKGIPSLLEQEQT